VILGTEPDSVRQWRRSKRLGAESGSDVRRETGKEERVKVPNDEELANHIVPESCAAYREVRREALTGVHIGQPLSRERRMNLGADTVSEVQGNTAGRDIRERFGRPGVVVETGMCARSLLGNREISGLTSRNRLARIGKARSRSQ